MSIENITRLNHIGKSKRPMSLYVYMLFVSPFPSPKLHLLSFHLTHISYGNNGNRFKKENKTSFGLLTRLFLQPNTAFVFSVHGEEAPLKIRNLRVSNVK
ncbi:hypothetical protein CFOL_v3_07986 [Cephalotus follicularis]|uniref:Uncharacterized protein n=1 Tax=Cephalotus follicularis TaxID=3775 RepID=A0A1Q3B908_CEPFO|nr:hypothetical protein CFOL_v3_07986 [Cephalotus follicularis]